MSTQHLTKKLVIGQQEWWIADADSDAVVKEVATAMSNRTTVELQLHNSSGHIVAVYLNGATAPSVALDLLSGGGPRPSEMSG
ncbi:MAG: hypothetical protein ABI140_17455, partial [Jatrophihabitantaceae bacterium]